MSVNYRLEKNWCERKKKKKRKLVWVAGEGMLGGSQPLDTHPCHSFRKSSQGTCGCK